jgi:hypothetical protein
MLRILLQIIAKVSTKPSLPNDFLLITSLQIQQRNFLLKLNLASVFGTYALLAPCGAANLGDALVFSYFRLFSCT